MSMTDAELQTLENLGHGDAAEEIRELRANFAALQHAIVGDTGASAILTAERLRAELDEWEKLRDPAVLHASLCRGVPAQLDRDALLHLAGVEQLRAELAASRHELDGAKKTANAQARLIDSLEQQRAHLNAQRDQWIEARDTLDSERAANAVLTEELAASREREARMRALIADDGRAMTFQSLGQYRTALLRALAEGAQG